MNPEGEFIDSRDKHHAELRFDFSEEYETQVVEKTLSELPWLKEQGYTVHLPEVLAAKIAHRETPTTEEISSAVASEYRSEEYETKATEVAEAWELYQEDFLQKLATLGLPVQDSYLVRLTKYGVGGAYHPPNSIDAMIHDVGSKDVVATLIHETIHLTIENLIEEFHIGEHWAKERIVDLIFGKFYPDRQELQKDPAQSEKIDDLFEKYYPDIRRVIQELSIISKK